MSAYFNPTNPIAIPRLRSHHVRIYPRNMQVCSTNPTSPRAHGPWAQTVLDILYPTPSLAFWLNNQLEHIPLNRLAAARQSCNMCYKRMCDDIHPPKRSVIQPPPPLPRAPTSPGKLKRLPNRLSTRYRYVRSPNMPSAPPPPMGDDICPDCANCEMAVRVMTDGCGHIFGSTCLLKWLWQEKIKCPICHALWFRGVNQQLMYVLLRENWQARKAE